MSNEEEKGTRVSPAIAGAAVYAGAPAVMNPLYSLIDPIARAAVGGTPLNAEVGTPIQRLAEFTREEVRTIQNFAKSRGVKVPIGAGDPALVGGSYFRTSASPLERLLARVTKQP